MFRRTLAPSTAAALLIAASMSGRAAASTVQPPVVPAEPAAPAPRKAEKPAIFDTRTYDEARKAAEDAGKWFIVKGTATWCPPCRQMDRTTWVDPKVVAWLEANAVAYALDVDKERATAASLGIEAMPTMIAFKDGVEFDRVVGGHAPGPFLDWLEGVGRGEKSIEAIRRRADRPAPDGNVDVDARYEKARMLLRSRGAEAIDEAVEEYVWLWKNVLEHKPAFVGVRSSYMADEMGSLAQRSPKAKARFTALRDETTRELEREKVDPAVLRDWLVLNEVIGDQAATLAWFDRVKDDRRWKPLLERPSRHLIELLEANERWADLGALIDDPVAEVRKQHEFLEETRAWTRQHAENGNPAEDAHLVVGWLEDAGRTYACVLADGRDDAALAAATEAMRLDPQPALLEALVNAALAAGQPRPVQLVWIDAALARRGTDPKGPDAALSPIRAERLRILRPKVEKALAAAKEVEASGAGKKSAP